jgi:hypothetical protein
MRYDSSLRWPRQPTRQQQTRALRSLLVERQHDEALAALLPSTRSPARRGAPRRSLRASARPAREAARGDHTARAVSSPLKVGLADPTGCKCSPRYLAHHPAAPAAAG